MRIAIEPQHHHDHGEFHLPHQGMWFLVMLVCLLLLLGKTVGSQCVIAYNSTLIPIAYPSTEKL